MSDPNRTSTKPDAKIDDPSNTENIDLAGSNQNANAFLHSTSNEEKDDISTKIDDLGNTENIDLAGSINQNANAFHSTFNEEKDDISTKIDDLGNTENIDLSGSTTLNADDASQSTSNEEKDDKNDVMVNNSELESFPNVGEEGKDDEKVPSISAQEKEISVTNEEKNLGKEPENEISSPPTVTVKQNDAARKETDEQITVVVSPLEELKEKVNLTPKKTTPKLNKIPIWKQEKEKYLNASLEERKRRRDKWTECFDIETWPEYCNKYLNSGKEEAHAENPEISNKVSIWKGDITSLLIDAIVNAANEKLLGGGGVDGAIHSAAGPLLKEECSEFGSRSAGESVITCAYNLPAKYVIHTVGPRGEYQDKLKDCYMSSLQLLIDENQRTIAFPCISTGIFGYPNDKAADVVLDTVRNWLEENHEKVDRVIFCLFLDKDVQFYTEKLLQYFPMKNFHTESPEEVGTENREERGLLETFIQKSITFIRSLWENFYLHVR